MGCRAADYDEAIRRDSGTAERYNARGDAYYYQAETLQSAGDDDQANALFEKAVLDYSRAIDISFGTSLYVVNRAIACECSAEWMRHLKTTAKHSD